MDSRGSIWIYGYDEAFVKYALRLVNVPITCNVAIDVDFFSQSGSEYKTSQHTAHLAQLSRIQKLNVNPQYSKSKTV